MVVQITSNVREVIADYNEAKKRLEKVPREISKRVAVEFRGGRSKWPVKTGRSRDGFQDTDKGITNRVPYAESVEARYGGVAERYFDERLKPVGDELTEEIAKEFNG